MLSHIVIVLVEPQHPSNVGSVARAMENMGLSRLVLVNPPCFDPERARWMAPHCTDIWEKMRIVARVEDALLGVHHAVATTARVRKLRQKIETPRELAQWAIPFGQEIAILFGREDEGLSNQHVLCCQSVLRIPTSERASLNLAQAVLLTAHALFEEAHPKNKGRLLGGRAERSTGELDAKHQKILGKHLEPIDMRSLEPMIEEIGELMDQIGFGKETSLEKREFAIRQIVQNARWNRQQAQWVRGMMRRFKQVMKNPHVDWTKGRFQK